MLKLLISVSVLHQAFAYSPPQDLNDHDELAPFGWNSGGLREIKALTAAATNPVAEQGIFKCPFLKCRNIDWATEWPGVCGGSLRNGKCTDCDECENNPAPPPPSPSPPPPPPLSPPPPMQPPKMYSSYGKPEQLPCYKAMSSYLDWASVKNYVEEMPFVDHAKAKANVIQQIDAKIDKEKNVFENLCAKIPEVPIDNRLKDPTFTACAEAAITLANSQILDQRLPGMMRKDAKDGRYVCNKKTPDSKPPCATAYMGGVWKAEKEHAQKSFGYHCLGKSKLELNYDIDQQIDEGLACFKSSKILAMLKIQKRIIQDGGVGGARINTDDFKASRTKKNGVEIKSPLDKATENLSDLSDRAASARNSDCTEDPNGVGRKP